MTTTWIALAVLLAPAAIIAGAICTSYAVHLLDNLNDWLNDQSDFWRHVR